MVKPKKRKCKDCGRGLTKEDGTFCRGCTIIRKSIPQQKNSRRPIGSQAYFKAPELAGVPKAPILAEPLEDTVYSSVWHNLTSEQVKALRKLQGDKCAICGRKLFLVLNCDKTGKARGYLCKGCAVKLAGIDDADFMGRAREYLKNSPANNLPE